MYSTTVLNTESSAMRHSMVNYRSVGMCVLTESPNVTTPDNVFALCEVAINSMIAPRSSSIRNSILFVLPIKWGAPIVMSELL